MREGNISRTTEEQSISLGKLAYGAFAPLQVDLSADQEKQEYRIALIERPSWDSGAKLTGASLEAYRGEEKIAGAGLVENRKMTGGGRVFELSWSPGGQSFDRLCIRAEYDNGRSFLKKLCPPGCSGLPARGCPPPQS